MWRFSVILVLLLTGFCVDISAQEELSPEAVRLFTEDAFPVLEENCLKCHGGGDEIKGSLTLASRSGLMRGGDRGPAVNLEDPAASVLLEMISWKDEDHQMPPKRELASWDKEALVEWVTMGAPWPGGGAEEEVPSLLHGFERDDPKLWAFQALERPSPPSVDDRAWSENPIDAFVYARLQAAGLEPAPLASKAQLIRRLYYDLTGLPPTAAEVESFVSDSDPAAYERLADRLLASPRYGEQWGRHWLDLVRYADSNGYERDGNKPFIWRYRDYVIDAFNKDKPYDQFVVEQLAGDELSEGGAEGIVATGFYQLGIWDDEPADRETARYDGLDDIVNTTGRVFLGMTMGCARCHDHKLDPIPQADYYRFLSFFQGIRITGMDGTLRSIMTPEEKAAYEEGLRAKDEEESRLTDARRDQLMAFRSALIASRPEIAKERNVQLSDLTGLKYRFYRDTWDALPEFDAIKFEDKGKIKHNFISTAPATRERAIGLVFEGKLRVPASGTYTCGFEARDGLRLIVDGETVQAVDELGHREEEFEAELREGLLPFRLEYFTKDGPPRLRLWWSGPDMERRMLSVPSRGEDGLDSLEDLFREYGEEVLSAEAVKAFRSIRREMRQNERSRPEGKFAASVIEPGREPDDTHILIRGNAHVKGKVVTPGFPVIFDVADPEELPVSDAYRSSGRRTQLADWIVDGANPLTARVMANRLWQFHFGRGIVRSPNNFGVVGNRPTHPELLDWLASEFVDGGWSMKRMHKTIVLSRTYRMSSRGNRDALAKDPTNNLFWRYDMRRLTAEEIRDSLLMASGTLNTKMHGPGIYPEMPEEALSTSSTGAGKWGESSPEEAARRSVYVHLRRSLLMPILTDFDLADTDASCPVRFSTTQPTQALGMLNSAFVNGQAELLAKRVEAESTGDEGDRVRLALEIATSRAVATDEVARGLEFIDEMAEVEGLSRERAFERFCLLALNLNEFVYLD